MPSYGYDYQLIKTGTVRELRCRVCGKKMSVKRAVFSGNSVIATLLGKSGIFDEFYCEYSGESWHETAMESVKNAENIINRDIINSIHNRNFNN